MISAEQATKSLIREFLIRRNLKETIKHFDTEYVSSNATISRLDLVKSLCMERVIKQNKLRQEPRQTLLEMLVDYLLGKAQRGPQSEVTIMTTATSQSQSSVIGKPPQKQEQSEEQVPPSVVQKEEESQQQSVIQSQQEVNCQPHQDPSDDFQQNSNIKQQFTKEPDSVVNNQSNNKQQPSKPVNEQKNVFDELDELDNMFPGKEEQKQPDSQPPSKTFNFKKKKDQQQEEKQVESNIVNQQETIEQNTSNAQNTQNPTGSFTYKPIEIQAVPDFEKSERDQDLKIYYGKSFGARNKRLLTHPIDNAAEVKSLIFQNSGFNSLPQSWKQGFIFHSDKDKPYYGLIQREGGPCGVLASVQAFYLKHYLFLSRSEESWNKDDMTLKQNCLIAALAEMLYEQIKDGGGQVQIAVPKGNNMSSMQAIGIEQCDRVPLASKNLELVYEALWEYKDILIGEQTQGVTLFFYSCILTKGIKPILAEMDTPNNSLIGNHGHCTQEAVNLLLTGKATSNTFDGENVIPDDTNPITLKGIHSQAQFGFLTVFEHLGYLVVGQNYKCPQYPVWIICKEYHYSVVFAFQDSAKIVQPSLKEFDLIFYDGLYAADDLIRLTVRREGGQKGNQSKQMVMQGGLTLQLDDDQVPSIEQVLKTKWGKDIEVDWNGSMPIL